MSTTIMVDHPSWQRTRNGELLRVVEFNRVVWVAHWLDESLVLRPVNSASMDGPPPAYTSSVRLPLLPEAQPLIAELTKLGTVARLTNPSLWDSVASAVLRQEARGVDAREVYRRLCSACGDTVDTVAGPMSLMPGPRTILAMSDAKFAEVGAALDRVALRSAAEAYLDRATDWPLRDADDLARSLAELPHISRWAARVATADYTGDFSVYPYDDLTVRTLAHKIAPALHLPSSDHEFVRMWRRWASDRTTLHSLTLFTLTWGAHARTHA